MILSFCVKRFSKNDVKEFNIREFKLNNNIVLSVDVHYQDITRYCLAKDRQNFLSCSLTISRRSCRILGINSVNFEVKVIEFCLCYDHPTDKMFFINY